MSVTRRSFLGHVGIGAAGVAAVTRRDALDAAERATAMEEAVAAGGEVTWGKAPCRFCGTGCGVQVGVRDGKVVAVRGDEKSPVNRGLLCAKGYHLPAFL
ncbi:MAG: twin-arginine translocation signal domain-containing protein [Planctomycetota bacterium]